jgi:23S rRNA (pseudouridine1915-N3)-methyltransferase
MRVLAVGKPRETHLLEQIREYAQRIRKPFALEVVWPKSLAALREQHRPTRVILDERGTELSSPELAAWIAARHELGLREIDFCIGDAYGFSDEDRQGATLVLALSRMTLPHRLAQLMLVEQLYRAFTIISGHPYHHE